MSSPKRRSITAEDLYQFELILEPRLSPDGQNVIYALQTVDQKTEKKKTNLWLTPVGGGGPRQFTYANGSNTSPRWSPDGTSIAFLSNRGEPEKPAQLYLLPFQGGEALPLTTFPGSILGFAWSPDGTQILCQVRKTDAEVLEREKDEQKKKLGVVSRHYDRPFFKLDGFGYLPKERAHLWVLNVKTGKTRQLTDDPVFDEGMPAWAPDSKTIAFVSNRSPKPDLDRDADDLFVLPVKGGEMRKIETPVGGKGMPSYSPDGRWIAYYGTAGRSEWYRNTGLWIVPADGSQAPHNLLEGQDLQVSNATINDLGSPEMVPPTWSHDGKKIFFPVVQHGKSILMFIQIENCQIETIIDEEGVVGTFDFNHDHTQMIYFFGSMENPGRIFIRDMRTGETKQLTHQNQKLLDELDLGEMETVWFKGPQDNDLQGWILKPPGFDPGKKYASILEIHGGPLTQYGFFFMHEFYYLAAQGYVVYFSNPRGGRGYGEQHAGAIWGGWGDADYADLMAWSDYVAKLPYIDTQRMGVTGGSYGGYMTVWIIGHTSRYQAAVTQRCVSNFISMWGSSDFNWSFQQVLGDKPPYEDLQKFWDHSPIKYIGNAVTPTLVIHSENDLRCPIEQGEQVFVALQKQGVDSEMVRFPDEFHGLSRTGRTDRRIIRLNHIRRWFDKYLSQP